MRSLAADSRQTHTYCFVDQHSRNRHIRAAIAAGGCQVLVRPQKRSGAHRTAQRYADAHPDASRPRELLAREESEHDGLLVAPRRTLRWRKGLRLRGHRGLRTCLAGFGPSHGRPSLPGRRNDPRPPLGAKAALLLAGLRWRWRSCCSSFGLPGSRPSFPLRRSDAPASSFAQDAPGRGGGGGSRRQAAQSPAQVGNAGIDVLEFLLVADQCGGEKIGVDGEWHKERLYAPAVSAARYPGDSWSNYSGSRCPAHQDR